MPCWSTSCINADPAGNGMRFGIIGTGYRGATVADNAIANGAFLVAIAETDSQRGGQHKQKTEDSAQIYGDYRPILDRKEIDSVAVCTPDHEHTKMSH